MNQTPLTMSRWSIATRLTVLTLIGCLTTALVGAVGLMASHQSNEALQSVYLTRLVPVAQLAQIQKLTLKNQQLLMEAALSGQADVIERNARELQGNAATITQVWKTYTSAPLNPEERALADRLGQARQRFLTEGLLPAKRALSSGDVAQGKAIILQVVPGLYGPVTNALADLVQQQLHAARQAYEDAEASFKRQVVMMSLALLSGTLLAGLAGVSLTRSLSRALGAEPHEVRAIAESVAQGDLNCRIALRPQDHHSVMAAMKGMTAQLAQVVSAVRHNADSVATASTQIAQGNSDLSQRTEVQASALQQTAASMHQLSTTVQNNADNARQASDLAERATDVAGQGGEVVGQVVDTMRGINDSSRKIADIIGVIDGIAFQTNILALNAAVEAARAGEQGRGFAVVAAEVRTLARRSADAAKEIKQLITHSVEQVERGTHLVDRAGQTMGQIVEAVHRVSNLVTDISAASVQQSTSVAQVGQTVMQMDQATQQNAALVEQSAAAAESLKQQARQLADAMAVFQLAPTPTPLGRALSPEWG